MANKRLTDLTELTTPADNDFLYIVDVSDTTESAQGTSKKIRKDKVDSGASKENISNKQNDLTPDGTGTKYPTVDAVNALSVNTIADLRLLTSPAIGQVVTLMGYYAKGDKRPVNYTWNASSTSADNGGSIIKITSITTGRWIASFGNDVTVKDFGAKVDGANDDTLFIQAMVNALGYFRLPIGTSKITNTLFIPNNNNFLGSIYSGEGMERSIINCVGMSGKSALQPITTSQYLRLTMRDFAIIGDSDICLNFNSDLVIYQSFFENLVLRSIGGDSFYTKLDFANTLKNVHATSDNGHSFRLHGGNSITLEGCYAHKCGVGKAGFRIGGGATMTSCTGLDSGDIWGWFGETTAEDGSESLPSITMIGCNIEDFNAKGIYVSNRSKLSLINTNFIQKASGTYDELIRFVNSGHTVTLENIKVTSKGSVKSSASEIVSLSGFGLLKSIGTPFVDYYVPSQSLLYPISNESLVSVESGKTAYKIPLFTSDRNYGFNLQVPVTWTANSATYAVTSQTKIKTLNTIATSFTNATGGKEGQELYIEIQDSFTTIRNLIGGSGRFKLLKGSDLLAVIGDVYHFINDGLAWVEVGSLNSVYSKINSPTFTGTPSAPTATSGTNTTQIATTAFAQGIRPYKVYTALLTQVGTDAPTAIVLENTIGAIVWSRSVIGGYFATLSGVFTTDKTSVLITNGSANSTYIHGAQVSTSNVNVITLADGQIDKATIEIRVYN